MTKSIEPQADEEKSQMSDENNKSDTSHIVTYNIVIDQMKFIKS